MRLKLRHSDSLDIRWVLKQRRKKQIDLTITANGLWVCDAVQNVVLRAAFIDCRGYLDPTLDNTITL
jgi:tRNA splicing ligase